MKSLRTKLALLASSVFVVFFASTHFAFAATSHFDVLGAYLLQIITFIDKVLVPIIFALAFLIFIWGIFQYFIMGATSEEKRDSGKQLMIWGLLGFFVMISIWGIVNLLVFSFGFGSDTRPSLPAFGADSAQTTSTKNQDILNNLKPSASSGALPQNVGDSCTTACRDGLSCISGKCQPYGDSIGPANPPIGPTGCPIYNGVELCT